MNITNHLRDNIKHVKMIPENNSQSIKVNQVSPEPSRNVETKMV